MGMGFQPQTLRLQRYGPAACKGVQQGRRGVMSGFHDLCFGFVQNFGVVGVLPLDQFFENPKQTLPLGVLFLLCRELLQVAGRIIHQTGPDNSPRCCQGPPRPPQVQGGRVPVPYRFFPRRFAVDCFQRQGDFDEFFGGGHLLLPP